MSTVLLLGQIKVDVAVKEDRPLNKDDFFCYKKSKCFDI